MNWPELLKDLRARGWTQVRLAERLGLAQSTLSELSQGKTEPRYSNGAALVALHSSGERPPESASEPEAPEPAKAL